ncbi:MAG: hypothetical protein V8R40_13255 [Dysosmobacter sp.]
MNLLNTNFTGISVDEMNLRLMALSEQVTRSFSAAEPDRGLRRGCAGGGRQREIVTAGQSQLLKLPEFRDADKAHQLMSFLDSNEKICRCRRTAR